MQNALCPECTRTVSRNGKDIPPQIDKCTSAHLKEAHNIHIEPICSITEEIMELTRFNKYNTDQRHRMTRKQIVDYAEDIIKPNLNRLKEFLKLKTKI